MIQFDAAMKDRIISANIIVLFSINPFQVGGSFKILLWHKVNGQARNQITKKWQLVHTAGFMWLRFLATVLCKALKIPVVTQTINTPNDIVKFDFACEASIFYVKWMIFYLIFQISYFCTSLSKATIIDRHKINKWKLGIDKHY